MLDNFLLALRNDLVRRVQTDISPALAVKVLLDKVFQSSLNVLDPESPDKADNPQYACSTYNMGIRAIGDALRANGKPKFGGNPNIRIISGWDG